MEENKWISDKLLSWRVFKYIIATVFLGAVGSGLWEMFLSDFTYNIASIVAKYFGSTFSSYIERLHEDIGVGLSERASTMLIVIFLFLMCCLFILVFINYYKIYRYHRKSTHDNDLGKKVLKSIDVSTRIKVIKIQFFIIASIVIIPLILYSTIIFEFSYRRKAIIFVERSIEIVSPYISTSEVLKLRSEYRSITTSKDFYHLEDKLHKIANENKISLPKFMSIKP